MTETAAPKPEPSGKARARTILLVVSLGLNLAVAGLAVGAWVQGPPGPRDGRDLGFGLFDEAFRDEDRRALREEVRERAGDLRSLRGQMSGDMGAVLAALRAEPFDVAALKSALARQQENLTRRIEIGTDVVAEYLAALPPDQRAAFADRIEKRMKRGRDEGRD